MLELGDPLGWDITYDHNYLKQHEYIAQMTLKQHNHDQEYQFIDVYEHLVLIMIIRREIINFALDKGHRELLQDPEIFYRQNYIRGSDDEDDDLPPDTFTDRGKNGPLDSETENKIKIKSEKESKMKVSVGRFTDDKNNNQNVSNSK